MKAHPYRRATVNIHNDSHELIALHIAGTANKWRCNRLMASVMPNGDIRVADINHNGRAFQADAADIIGTFGFDTELEVIEDAVLEQKRQMSAGMKEAA